MSVNYEPFQFYRLCEEVQTEEEMDFAEYVADLLDDESLADQLAAEAIAEDAAENLEEKP